MNKKIVLILIIALCAFSVAAEPIDVVVMLDTSESVLPIYNDLVNYIVKNVLTNHVRFGDTFHLISFDSKPELIYSRQLQNSDDLEEVVADLFLLNPLGKHTDLIMALKYLNQHVSSLSDSVNSEIIILTDGIHDPPEGSPFMSVFETDNEGNKINILEKELNSITRNGFNISLVKLPETNTGYSDQGSNQSDSPQSLSENRNNILSDNKQDNESNKSDIIVDSSENSETSADDNQSISSTDNKIITSEIISERETAGDDNQSGSLSNTDNQNNVSSEDKNSDKNIFSFTENNSSKIYQTDFNSEETTENSTATGSPRIIYPEKMGKIKYHFSIPVEIENFYNRPILLKLEKAVFQNMNILKEKYDIKLKEQHKKKITLDMQLPYSIEPGKMDLEIRLIFSDRNRAYPETAVIPVTLKKSFSDFIKDINIVFKIIFIIMITAVLMIFFFIFFSSFIHVSVRDSYNVIKKDFEEMVSDKGLRPLALKVVGQNDTRIGTRNIHSFNEKSVKTLGGGHSSYLIFLYKIPSHIAEINHSDGKYILTVKESKYFPDISKEKTDIVYDRKIRIKTDNDMKLECYFYEYISPLEQINSIMQLTDHRGMPDNRLSIYS